MRSLHTFMQGERRGSWLGLVPLFLVALTAVAACSWGRRVGRADVPAGELHGGDGRGRSSNRGGEAERDGGVRCLVGGAPERAGSAPAGFVHLRRHRVAIGASLRAVDAASRPRQHREADDFERLTTSTESVVASVAEAIARQDLAVDYVQVDAGWYRLLPDKLGKDCGDDGPPFIWDPERRFQLRCEIDAAFFHLYGISRDDTAYILDSFPVLKRSEEREHGEYRTKRGGLEIYDALASSATSGLPYESPLEPPRRAK